MLFKVNAFKILIVNAFVKLTLSNLRLLTLIKVNALKFKVAFKRLAS
jgi:hypothetical protein